MVKRSRVVEREVEGAADVPYERTRLALRAPAGRRRLAGLLALGALLAFLDAALGPSRAGALVAAGFLAACAWGVRKGSLAGLIGAAFAALMGLLLPVSLWFLQRPELLSDRVVMGLAMVLGASALPDVLLLVRDAELQHAYGLWARRDA